MKKLHVVTDVTEKTTIGDDGEPTTELDEHVDEFAGEHVSFATEPSGVLVVFDRPNSLWAAYAPGSWRVVRDVSRQN